MSTEALKQVLPHPSRPPDPPLKPSIQLLLAGIAWKTPQGRDWTGPLSYADISKVTYQSIRTIQRLVLEAISINALEVAWSSPGQPARYRINRGDWHIPTDPGELKATLAKLTGVQESLDILSETPDILSGDPGQNGAPLKEERKKEEEGPSVFETHNPELITRLREKGVIQ